MRAVRVSILIASSVVVFEQVSVAQTSPPPAGYQQPAPYGQQPGYYQQPPTAYQPPPPGYAAAPPPPRGKHGFLALPYLGFESHRGDTGVGLGAGAMFGVLLGGRINEMFSINGEFRVDVLNPTDVMSGYDVTIAEVDLAVSPLFHVPFDAGEFVVGPKLGFFGFSEQDKYDGVDAGKYSASGFVAGVNSGVFFNVSRSVELGGMLSLTIRDPSQRCSTPAGGVENCNSTIDYVAEKVIGFHAGALF